MRIKLVNIKALRRVPTTSGFSETSLTINSETKINKKKFRGNRNNTEITTHVHVPAHTHTP